ncbi:hypothetical protein CVV65_15065 [Kyrpidia spormannii]|uniref:DUF4194 domain-containing protein n=1 Tax=Kyrpidia spormannii TaxID=2055160 RepID=A0A2K8N9U1_9BACL|nr:DUF4194 domain-containing protein [Kyrpidia spormannii]ATY86084.1 hypothetical protein CVV65_15065 [Kyrpidia spormannii]
MWQPDVSEQEQERLRSLINRLIAVNFLVKEKEREAYLLVRRHREWLERFFRFLGWDLVVDERHECVFVHAPDAGLRRRLNREQTIGFLVLRLIYEEKRRSLSLSATPVTTVYEIRSKYETFRLPWLNRTQLDQLVQLCTRYQLLEVLDDNIRSDECRLRLYHTWMYVVDTRELSVIGDKIERFAGATEGGFLDEMDETSAAD